MRVIPHDELMERTLADLKKRREAERLRKICARSDYWSYHSEIVRRQRNGTFRKSKPKGAKA